MLPLAGAVISAIPSIIKLFNSDERGDGVKELTSTIVKEAGQALDVEFNTKDDVLNHLAQNPEAAFKLRDIETKHIQALASLELENKKEDNRHEESFYTKAHETYQNNNVMADSIAKQIISRNLPIIGALVVINILVVYFMQEHASLIAIASNIIGVAIGNLFNERQTIVNFFFGRSSGEVENNNHILEMTKKGK